MGKAIIQKKALQAFHDGNLMSDNLLAGFQKLARFSEESNANFGEVKLIFGDTEDAEEEGYALELILRVVTPRD